MAPGSRADRGQPASCSCCSELLPVNPAPLSLERQEIWFCHCFCNQKNESVFLVHSKGTQNRPLELGTTIPAASLRQARMAAGAELLLPLLPPDRPGLVVSSCVCAAGEALAGSGDSARCAASSATWTRDRADLAVERAPFSAGRPVRSRGQTNAWCLERGICCTGHGLPRLLSSLSLPWRGSCLLRA